MRTPHEILNVPYSASPEEIRRAYQSWAKLVHPDRVEDELKEFATGLMQDINGAYQALNSGQKTTDVAGQNGVEEYLGFLRKNIEVRQSKDDWQLTLPYWSLPATALTFESDASGPFLNLYIKQDRNGSFTITDRGENLKCLTDFGHDIDMEDAKEHIAGQLFPVTLQRDIIRIRSQDCPSLGEAIDCLAKAIVWMDYTYDIRIHNWYKAQEFVRQRNKVTLMSGFLSEADYNSGMVFQSIPFLMNRAGQRLHILLIPDPFWVMGEVKLTRIDGPIFANESTVIESAGFSEYEQEVTAKDESWHVPEINKSYRLTVSGKGGFVLAAYKTM